MSNSANEVKTFNILDVLSVSSGRLMLKMDGVYEVMDWLMQTDHTTLGLVVNHDRRTAEILRQHPWLQEVSDYIEAEVEKFPPRVLLVPSSETGPRPCRPDREVDNPEWEEAWEALKADILAKWTNEVPLYHTPMDDRELPPHDIAILKQLRPDLTDDQIIIHEIRPEEDDGSLSDIGRIPHRVKTRCPLRLNSMAKVGDILVKMDRLQESIDRLMEMVKRLKVLWEELEEAEKEPLADDRKPRYNSANAKEVK